MQKGFFLFGYAKLSRLKIEYVCWYVILWQFCLKKQVNDREKKKKIRRYDEKNDVY